MNPIDIIRAKRDGRQLSVEQINWFVQHYADGTGVGDDQAAAMAMAIYFQGLDETELAAWTGAMINSGARLDLRGLARPTVDKHSTGGVGDKISLILVPLLVACGAAVPQLSGRGLGHTGGTLDKMEAIAGWRAKLSVDELRHVLATVGGVIAAATDDLAPADAKLYALRDVTSTVDSIPLIASSIMSKKIAEGTSALVLDVKAGSGAFMTDVDDARELARTMVGLGQAHGVATSALITPMNNVLGRAVGNSLEVAEALDVLDGGGPADVVALTVALATEMVRLVNLDIDPGEVLASGRARPVFDKIVAAQGGDLSLGLPVAPHTLMVPATRAGFVNAVQAMPVGVAAWRLGAGRAAQGDTVSATAGVLSLVAVGDEVVEGQPVLELHAERPDRFTEITGLVEQAVVVGDTPAEVEPVIIDRITGSG